MEKIENHIQKAGDRKLLCKLRLLPKHRQHKTTQSARAFSDSNAWKSNDEV
jgi:hypothetical protein